MIKYKLLKKEEEKHIAILCYNDVDFWTYLDAFRLDNKEIGYKTLKHNEIIYYCISKYEDLINKRFNTYKLTKLFVKNPCHLDIICNIQKHIICE